MASDHNGRDEVKPYLSSAAPMAVFGAAVGLLITLDPMLTNIASGVIGLSKGGVNLLKVFPFQLTALVFLAALAAFLLLRLFSRAAASFEKSWILLFLLTAQTIALFNVGPLDLADLVVLVFAIIFAVRLFIRDEKMRLSPLDLLNILLLAAIILSTIFGSLYSVLKINLAIKLILLAFLFANSIRTTELLDFFFKCLLVITTVSSVIAIAQEVSYLGVGYTFVGFVDEDQMRFMFDETSFGHVLRVPAVMASYKIFAFFLVTAMILAANRVIYTWGKISRREVLYLALAFGTMSVALVLTFSKDSMIALFAGMALTMAVRWPRFLFHATAAAAIFMVLLYAFGVMDDIARVLSTEIYWGEQRIRLQLAREGIQGFFNRHTLIGVGFGKGYLYTAHFFKWPVHNNFILAADEIGLLGLVAYLAPITYIVLKMFAQNLVAMEDSEKAAARGMIFSIIALLVVHQTHAGYLNIILWMYLGVAQGMIFMNTRGKAVV